MNTQCAECHDKHHWILRKMNCDEHGIFRIVKETVLCNNHYSYFVDIHDFPKKTDADDDTFYAHPRHCHQCLTEICLINGPPYFVIVESSRKSQSLKWCHECWQFAGGDVWHIIPI